MTPPRRNDPNQLIIDFFHDLGESLALDNGSSEKLSDFEFRLRQLLKTVLDDVSKRQEDPLDRFEVAARMSRALNREITKGMVDQWIAMSAVSKRIHVDALKALCDVTGDVRPLHFFCESMGFKALEPDLAVCAEYGAKMLMRRAIEGDIKETLANVDESAVRSLLMKRIKT